MHIDVAPLEPTPATIHHAISRTEDIIEAARNGRPYILVDAEDRENEGDVIIPAQFATPAQINFMARHARGPGIARSSGSLSETLRSGSFGGRHVRIPRHWRALLLQRGPQRL